MVAKQGSRPSSAAHSEVVASLERFLPAGTLTTYDGDDKTCTPHVYTAGQVFVDRGYGHVHMARNEGSVPLEVHVTLIDVPVGGDFRIDAPDPGNCPF